MRNLYFLIFTFLFLSCEITEKEAADCAAVSCLADTVVLQLVDNEGNNLIENGTYKKGDIKVFSEGYNRGEVSSIPDFGNVIFVTLSGGEGDVDYEITLNETQVEPLGLNLAILRDGGDCCPPDYKVKSAIFKGEEQEIIRGEEFPSETIILVQ